MSLRTHQSPRQITSNSFETTPFKNYDQLMAQISFEGLSLISSQLSNRKRKYLLKKISRLFPQDKACTCLYQNLYDTAMEGNFVMFKHLLKHYSHEFTQFDISTSFELAATKTPFLEENKKMLYHLLRYFQHQVSKESIKLAYHQLSSSKDKKFLNLLEFYLKTNISIQIRKYK